MCTYCMIGDWQFQRNPPWYPNDPFNPWPAQIPRPLPGVPINPWPIDQVREFMDLVRRVKELEDKLGCPCEPNKADYIALLQKRIEALEQQTAKQP